MNILWEGVRLVLAVGVVLGADVLVGTMGVLAYEWWKQARDQRRRVVERLHAYGTRDTLALYGRRSDDGYHQYRSVDDTDAA
jgi:hypothetical protein